MEDRSSIGYLFAEMETLGDASYWNSQVKAALQGPGDNERRELRGRDPQPPSASESEEVRYWLC